MSKTIPAIKVMYAVHSVFSNLGDEDYAKKKTNLFLRECGADIEKPKEQPLAISEIKEVAQKMLDFDNEELLWIELNR